MAGALAAGLLLQMVFEVFAHEPSQVFLKGPYLQAPGADTMTIMWESPTNKPGIVRLALNGRFEREVQLEEPRPLTSVSRFSVTNFTENGEVKTNQVSVTNLVFIYEITLTNLRPNSIYAYMAETDGVRVPPKQFRTLAARPQKVRFIAYGDTRTNPKTHEAVAARFKQHSPDFILHTGDLVAAGKRYDLWGKEFFGPLARVVDEVPFMPTIGNHEEDGSNYIHYVHLPGNELWYSYDVGPVHVLVLDYRNEKETHEQYEFAKKDLLASKASWKIVTLHHPVFNVGGHGTGWGHASYLPLFREARIDLVLVGHSHLYERFRPMISANSTEMWPITHITTGGGGAPLTTCYAHPALMAQAATNHYVVIDATATSLKGRAFTTNDVLIDSFEIRKRNGKPSANYLAQAYAEEAMKLSFIASTNLAAGLASVPTNTLVAQAMFTIHPLQAVATELEIMLTPNSAPFYDMPGGSLRVTAPALGEPSKVFWTKLKATGKQTVVAQGRNRELSPALTFQARVRGGTMETLAYGRRSRVSAAATEAAKKLEEEDANNPKVLSGEQ
jgi:predicted phosphodiesterase